MSVPSLTDLINPKTPDMPYAVLKGYHYRWHSLYSAEAVRKIHADRPYQSVRIDTENCNFGYGCSVMAHHESWLYPEGDILMCVTTREFAGTFASHDDIEVRYFHLKPEPTWANRTDDDAEWRGYHVSEW